MANLLSELKKSTDYHYTQNGGLAHANVDNDVYKFYSLAGAYRCRPTEDKILLFKNAYDENPDLAIKCLFFVRDIRGGLGERQFFRDCYHWLASYDTEAALKNMQYIPEYGRVDDLYCLDGTPLETDMYIYLANLVKKKDILKLYEPYYIFKWLKSENTSSYESRRLAKKTRQVLGLTPKQYRQMLSKGREEERVLERIMSDKDWDSIEFDKIPAKAGLRYRQAFMNRPELHDRYAAFAKSSQTKVNADTLYPYELVARAREYWTGCNLSAEDGKTERMMLEKYWNALPNPFENGESDILCVCDTSNSMTWKIGKSTVTPIDVAIALSMFCGERCNGEFKDHYISFASRPQLIKIEGIDFVDKVNRIYKTNLMDDTNLLEVFQLLRYTLARHPETHAPKTIVVLSDMEINFNAVSYGEELLTEMETERVQWEAFGLTMPHLVYWNINAMQDNFLDDGPNVSYVSGFSQSVFESILSGKTGYDMCLDKLMSERYAAVGVSH